MAYSDDHLNAFVDRQLPPEDEYELLQAMNHNRQLRERVEALQRLRALVKYSFRDAGEYASSASSKDENKAKVHYHGITLKRALAASLLLSVGILLGWGLHSQQPGSRLQAHSLQNMVNINPLQLADTETGNAKAIIHLSSDDQQTINSTLDKAATLLEEYEAANKQLQLEILVNADGLNLLRADTSPAKYRVSAMQKRYANLTFLACKKTIRRLKLEKNIDAELLPGVVVVPSALDQILRRLQDDWNYIRA